MSEVTQHRFSSCLDMTHSQLCVVTSVFVQYERLSIRKCYLSRAESNKSQALNRLHTNTSND